jgi:zinc/manganese transport system substrate-binding protein
VSGRCRRCATTLAVAAAAALVALSLSACSPAATAADGRLQIVTSTDVYADIVRALAGSSVDVTSFIDSPEQDPHSFEASPRDQLALSRADVIIENGGGYDDFMNRMRTASAKRTAVTIDVVALSGHSAPKGGDLNEHVWYDFPTVERLAARLTAVFAARRPALSGTLNDAARRFVAKLHGLERSEAAIRARYNGSPVAITEPVPDYLLSACGLVNRTPEAFSAGVEAGTEVSASALEQTLHLFDAHAVRALVYNEQTSGVETTRVRAAAAANGIPAVPVTETLPTGDSYLSWMQDNLARLQRALAA